MKVVIGILVALGMVFSGTAQENYKKISEKDSVKIYNGGEKYKVKKFPHRFKSNNPKNIILMIGDGMGVAQVYAGLTANNGHLFLENLC